MSGSVERDLVYDRAFRFHDSRFERRALRYRDSAPLTASAVLDYEALYGSYQTQITEKLRNFNDDVGVLQYWVPSPDLEKSLVGLFQSFLEVGQAQADVLLRGSTVTQLNRSRLSKLLAREGAQFTERREGDAIVLALGSSSQFDDGGRPTLADEVGPRAEARALERKDVASCNRDLRPDVGEPATIGGCYLAALQSYGAPPSAAHNRPIGISAAGELNGVTVKLDVESGGDNVANASHAGARATAACLLLDAFCGFAAGEPVQELADHGSARLEAALRGRSQSGPLPGINHSRAIDPAFRWLDLLIRRAAADWRRQAGIASQTNDYDRPLAAHWAALPKKQRLSRLNSIVARAMQKSGLNDSAEVVAIEHEVRVVIRLPERLVDARAGHLLLVLEREIKIQADPRLEVHQLERRDISPLRRLKQGEDT